MTKLLKLRRTLRKLGFTCRRGKGSHEVWTDPQQPRRRVVLSGNGGEDARKYQAARVRKLRGGAMVYQQEGKSWLMNGLFVLIGFVWTLIVFFAGWLTHWWATREQRRLLKLYRQQAQAFRQWIRPVEE